MGGLVARHNQDLPVPSEAEQITRLCAAIPFAATEQLQ
jgi:hypothetical protein